MAVGTDRRRERRQAGADAYGPQALRECEGRISLIAITQNIPQLLKASLPPPDGEIIVMAAITELVGVPQASCKFSRGYV